MSVYPTGIDSFTTKVDNVDDVMASDVNNLQTSIVAIETTLGINPSFGVHMAVFTGSTTWLAPSGISQIMARLWGGGSGGGGGGAGDGATNGASGTSGSDSWVISPSILARGGVATGFGTFSNGTITNDESQLPIFGSTSVQYGM